MFKVGDRVSYKKEFDIHLWRNYSPSGYQKHRSYLAKNLIIDEIYHDGQTFYVIGDSGPRLTEHFELAKKIKFHK